MGNLYQLIKSLSKNEKRYFKLYANSFAKEPGIYVKLFDAIDKQDEYNEQEIVESFAIKHMAVTKKYLFDAILKSLRNYHSEQNQVFQLLDALKNLSILRNKGLIKESIKIYEKTEKQLLENHLYTFLIELLNTGEVLWAAYLPNKEMTNKMVELHEEKQRYIQYLENITSYRALARNIKNTMRLLYPIRNEEQEAEILIILSHPLLSNVNQSTTPIAKSIYYECRTLCHMALLNHEKVRNSGLEVIEFLTEQKDRSVVHYKTLLANLTNSLLACAKLQDEENFKLLTQKYEQIKLETKGKISSRFDVILKKLYYNFMTHYCIEKNDFQDIIKIEPEVIQFWKNHDDFLDTDWRMTLSFFFAQSFFFEKNYIKAQEWVEIILEEEKNNPKTPCICNARILNLMIQYEKGNFMLLYSLFRSTYRYLNKNERLFKCERAILNFFKWVGENDNSYNLPDKFKKLSSMLEELAAVNKYEKNFFDEMKLNLWLREKNNQLKLRLIK